MGTHLWKRPDQAADVGESSDNHERSRHGSQMKSGSALRHEQAGGGPGSTSPPWRNSNGEGRMVTRTRTSGSLRTSSCQAPFIRGCG